MENKESEHLIFHEFHDNRTQPHNKKIHILGVPVHNSVASTAWQLQVIMYVKSLDTDTDSINRFFTPVVTKFFIYGITR